jgi:hypothetical protein
MQSYTDSAAAREIEGAVARRGLCGDVFLVSLPKGARLSEVDVRTSVRDQTITIDTSVEDLPDHQSLQLQARILQGDRVVKEITSDVFQGKQLNDGRLVLTRDWMPDRLWDLHTPRNIFHLEVTLIDPAGPAIDAMFPVRFGFREFWIDGKDFYLNGSRIFLSAVPLDNAQVSAAAAGYDAAFETLSRLKSFGINFVYTHNYGCEPGAHLSFEEILRAADDVGMLVALSQPHFSHYEWQAPDADQTNGYAEHARFYANVAGSHPSVVAYSTSHNATGYSNDMNPNMIDGIQSDRSPWAKRNVDRALRAEAIVRKQDSSRIIYHHASGNLSTLHAINFYPNFVPIQELSDWFGHWSSEGVKPVFMCEYGAPFSWDWTMYRGWYDGKREFGSAVVPWEFCLAEWNAQFLGDTAYRISVREKANLRWEARQLEAGNLWHRWDYPNRVGSTDLDERYPIFAMYLNDNWRAFRTWMVSAISPWEFGHFWKLREGVDKGRKTLPVEWEKLQRPGFSPDFVDAQYERMDLAFKPDDWIATPAAKALYRNNGPLLAYIAGKPGAFTSKDHIFFPGETVEKQLIVINNSREPASVECTWAFDLPDPCSGRTRITLPTGEQQRIPLSFDLPSDLAKGPYTLKAEFEFTTGEIQKDQFVVHIVPRPEVERTEARIAVFDPHGKTSSLLSCLGYSFQTIEANSELDGYDVLVIGSKALTPDGVIPDLAEVRNGLRVIVFEQTSAALQKRLGFRTQEYGLRTVFSRVPNHPYLAGIDDDQLRDWRGEAGIVPPVLDYYMSEKYNSVPAVEWCGLEVPRIWRCGTRGNVASVLIEKPGIGDFLPIVDGGFSLQYSPLLEYREGEGMVLFCQMDVTARSESEPAAARLVANIMNTFTGENVDAPIERGVVFSGSMNGRREFERRGIVVSEYEGGALDPNDLLVVGEGDQALLKDHAQDIAEWLESGGRMLVLQLDAEASNPFLPRPIQTARKEHIASCFPAPTMNSPFVGICPADLHNRVPRDYPVITAGAEIIANGMLASQPEVNTIFCQFTPDDFADAPEQLNRRRTFRRSSFLLTRLLGNLGVRPSTPLLDRFSEPVVDQEEADQSGDQNTTPAGRWRNGLYVDTPVEWDDPYRFFRW